MKFATVRLRLLLPALVACTFAASPMQGATELNTAAAASVAAPDENRAPDTFSAVPEPATALLCGAGLLGAMLMWRRGRSR